MMDTQPGTEPTTPIARYVKRRRAQLGKTQRQLAADAGTSPAYISQIEGGKVSLPGAALRRALASGLGVSHLDILVACGELTPEEAGQPESREDAAGAVLDELRPLLREVRWSPGRVSLLRATLEHFRDDDRLWAESGRPDTAAPDRPAPTPPASRK